MSRLQPHTAVTFADFLALNFGALGGATGAGGAIGGAGAIGGGGGGADILRSSEPLDLILQDRNAFTLGPKRCHPKGQGIVWTSQPQMVKM